MRRLSSLKEGVEPWQDLEKRLHDAGSLLDLAIQERDTSLEEEIAQEIAGLGEELEDLESRLLLNGEYDYRDAILGVHAGAGGTDSQDWAQMLLRMYLRWAEREGHRTRILDTSPGEEAGVKSATVEVAGRYAYGYLKAERGVHRLVRLSPFDAAHRRHTSFALVEVLPEVDEVKVEINPEDLRIETFRSSGPGGQHVQKSSTAVRIIHVPTGIIATCQNERSQLQNKTMAMKVLKARLMDHERRRQEEEQARLRGEHVSAEWGNQIRSYVLHPYTMVKDHRTGRETGDVNAVLDGEIDGFIEDYLKSQVGRE
jgi:peptide chain release factor 2